MIHRQIYILSFILTFSFIGGVVIVLASWSPGPEVDVGVADLVDKVVIVDSNQWTVEEMTYQQFIQAKLKPEWYEAHVELGDKVKPYLNDDMGIYFPNLLVPLKVEMAGAPIITFGDFYTGKRSRQDSGLVRLTSGANQDKLVIKFRLNMHVGNQKTILRSAGVGNYNAFQHQIFISDFMSSYGFLGLIFVFICICASLLILWANFGGSPIAGYLAVVAGSLAYLSFVYSRIYLGWESASLILFLHYINYLVPLPFVGLVVRLSQPDFTLKKATTFLVGAGVFLLLGVIGIQVVVDYSAPIHGPLIRGAFLVYLLLWLALTIVTVLGVSRLNSTDRLRKATIIIAFIVILLGYINDIARMNFRDLISNNIGPYYWCVAFLLFLAGIFNFVHQRYKSSIVNEKTLAIAKTTQMLAHDVRKPFSMIENLLIVIRNTNDTELLKKLVGENLQDVKKAIHSVNSMLQDITEIGAPANHNIENVYLEAILSSSIKEVCEIYPNASIKFHYDLKEQRPLSVAPYKIQRVISNILVNAFQAMSNKGSIIIGCHPVGRSGYCELSIKNIGSFIEPADLEKLFDAFFTKGKRKGTGLGLSISKKIIEDHGGEIRAVSDRSEPSVVFYATLPTSNVSLDGPRSALPQHSSSLRSSEPQLEVNESSDPYTHKVESRTLALAEELARAIRIGLLDDEEIYHLGVRSLLRAPDKLKQAVEIVNYASIPDMMAGLENDQLDVLICDVDLGHGQKNGFAVVKDIRASGNKIPICIHSNRISSMDYSKAIEVGAQAFLPKPMGRNQLLRFLLGNLSV